MSEHYIVFGPQISHYKNNLYTDFIGDFVGFKVSKNIDINNWLENQEFNNYLSLIKFEPKLIMKKKLMLYRKKYNINSFNTYEELIEFFNNNDNKEKYKVVHSLQIDNDGEYTCINFDNINKESIIDKIIYYEEIDNYYYN